MKWVKLYRAKLLKKQDRPTVFGIVCGSEFATGQVRFGWDYENTPTVFKKILKIITRFQIDVSRNTITKSF